MGFHGSTCCRVCACGQALSPAPASSLLHFPHGTKCIQPELLMARHPGVGRGCKAGWGEGLTPCPPPADPLPTWISSVLPSGWLSALAEWTLKLKSPLRDHPRNPFPNIPSQHLLPSFPVLAHGGHVGSGGETGTLCYVTGQMCRSRPLPPALTALTCPFGVTRLARGSGPGMS